MVFTMDAGSTSMDIGTAHRSSGVVGEAAQMIQHFDIAVPPSANKIWRNVNGRTLKSREYRRWLDVTAWEIRIQQQGRPLEGPATVSLSLRRPRANADIDNRIKPVLDALEAGGAIVNDKQVTCITAAWADHDGCRVTVGPDVS